MIMLWLAGTGGSGGVLNLGSTVLSRAEQSSGYGLLGFGLRSWVVGLASLSIWITGFI